MRIRVFLTVFIILLTTAVSSAWANGMPVLNRADDFTGSVLPAAETPVRIESEILTIDFRQIGSDFSWLEADVSAAYTLHNPTTDTLTVTVLFIGDYAGDVHVRLNDVPVFLPLQKISLAKEYAAQEKEAAFVWYDPFSKEPYSSSSLQPGKAQQAVQAVPFDISLPPGSHQLHVGFPNKLGYDRSRYPNPVFHLTYLLQPASNWAAFKDLKIIVNLPQGNYRLASSLPLEKTGGQTWSAAFSELPDEDLHLSVMSAAGLWFGRFSTRGYMLLFLAAILSLPVLYRRTTAHLLPGKAGSLVGIALYILAGWFAWHTLFATQVLMYPFTALQLLILLLITIWLIRCIWRETRELRSTKAV
ncbi:MAG: hypothetical protein SCK29_08965 [Bacillota bacterium]|nr:hypothetical protein [Bacillota bacterium]MDW7684229.1 hypothetical protein [Bacillota bacterium]